MKSIMKFNELLNKSDDFRFEYWTDYRLLVSNFICQNMFNKTGDICILGSGNSDDIDLYKISKKSNSLCLSDIDENSLIRSINKYNLDEKTTHILVLDYLGLENDSIWNNFVKEVIKIDNKNSLDTIFDQLKNKITKCRFDQVHKFDTLIISPIYTQLLFQQGLTYISILDNLNYPLDLMNYTHEKLLWLMPYVIDTFNNNIMALLNDSANVIVLSDIFEAKKNSPFYKKASNLNMIEAIYDEYKKTYGLGLGDYGLDNISRKLAVIDSEWFEWPFNKEKSLFVKALVLKK